METQAGQPVAKQPTPRERSNANLQLFQSGVSGNPRGRPKRDLDVAGLARSYTREAIETLAQIMMDEGAPPAARVSAANSLLDRGFGKAPQSLDMNHKMSLEDSFEDFVRQINAGPKAKVIPAVKDELSGADHEQALW